MKIAKGPRPWSIHLFAITLISTATYKLVSGLLSVEQFRQNNQGLYPYLELDSDLSIILMCAITTIVLIPVVAIWVFGSSIARILVVLMAYPEVNALFRVWVLDLNMDTLSRAEAAIRLTAIALLFVPASSRWLRSVKDDKRINAANVE